MSYDDEDAELKRIWEKETLPEILSGQCWDPEFRTMVDAAFDAYSSLEGLRSSFRLGVESRNCESMIPNEYPHDDPKHRAFEAGYRFGTELWGSDEL